jgi:hypothetical protein
MFSYFAADDADKIEENHEIHWSKTGANFGVKAKKAVRMLEMFDAFDSENFDIGTSFNMHFNEGFLSQAEDVNHMFSYFLAEGGYSSTDNVNLFFSYTDIPTSCNATDMFGHFLNDNSGAIGRSTLYAKNEAQATFFVTNAGWQGNIIPQPQP